MAQLFHTCNISKVFNMVAIGCVSNCTNSCIAIILHTSVFSGSSEISKYLYYLNCLLTWGKIWVACYFWMALQALGDMTPCILRIIPWSEGVLSSGCPLKAGFTVGNIIYNSKIVEHFTLKYHIRCHVVYWKIVEHFTLKYHIRCHVVYWTYT